MPPATTAAKVSLPIKAEHASSGPRPGCRTQGARRARAAAGRRARAAVICSSIVSSVMASLPSAPSNQAKNSQSAAPNVDGLIASMRGTAGSMAWNTPQVTRAGSISSFWSSSRAAPAAVAGQRPALPFNRAPWPARTVRSGRWPGRFPPVPRPGCRWPAACARGA
ncbi:hypothetical protein G6F31_019335 [Rhizopus arrhizus]|nr:hypothetical protein G6F31_019335 [Rhizopus arrhizus]